MRRLLASAWLPASPWLARAASVLASRLGPASGLRRALALSAAVGLCLTSSLAAAAAAHGSPRVSLHASLHPKIPGRSTTIRITIEVAPDDALVPPPLLSAELRYPAGIDVQLSGLGIAACGLATLEALGPQGCPPDSVMGYGRAIAEVPIKDEAISETARVAIVRAAERDGHLALMLVVYEEPALSAQIVLSAELLPAASPFGGLLAIDVPLISTFPEGPNVSVTKIELVLGPRHLRYRERVRGKLVHYEPSGIKLPERCTRGGYRFAVRLHFLDGSEAAAGTSVPCPRRGTHARSPRRSE